MPKHNPLPHCRYTLHPDLLEQYVLINSRELVCEMTQSKTDCVSREASPHIVGFYKVFAAIVCTVALQFTDPLRVLTTTT
jgi:hypothetical protein